MLEVVNREGNPAVRPSSNRPTDEDLLAALRSLELPAVKLSPAAPMSSPEEDEGALRTEAFDRHEVMEMSEMAASFLDAWKQRRSAPASN